MALSDKTTPVQFEPRDKLRWQACSIRFPKNYLKFRLVGVIFKNLDNKSSKIGQIATKKEFARSQMDLVLVTEPRNCFPNKKHSKSVSGIGFETFYVIFNHEMITKLKL